MRLPLLACLLLSACGQAGDLYLPGDQPATKAPAPQTQPQQDPQKKKDAR